MSKREKYIERQLACTLNEVKRIKEKNNVLEASLEETKRKNKILTNHLMQKETYISHLKVNQMKEEEEIGCGVIKYISKMKFQNAEIQKVTRSVLMQKLKQNSRITRRSWINIEQPEVIVRQDQAHL